MRIRIGSGTGLTPEEAEEVFFHEPLVVRSDVQHSKGEKRHYALGQTSAGRRLFVVFTVRRKLIRVISVRDMNRNERLPVSMIEDLKVLAHRRDVPYQSLLKVFLAERLARERRPQAE
jgi:uncharacterized DUF497 family protein